VLRALLRRLWDARRCEPVRLPLTGALLEYLQLSRGPRLLRLPPAVLQAVLKGVIRALAGHTLTHTACCTQRCRVLLRKGIEACQAQLVIADGVCKALVLSEGCHALAYVWAGLGGIVLN